MNPENVDLSQTMPLCSPVAILYYSYLLHAACNRAPDVEPAQPPGLSLWVPEEDFLTDALYSRPNHKNRGQLTTCPASSPGSLPYNKHSLVHIHSSDYLAYE